MSNMSPMRWSTVVKFSIVKACLHLSKVIDYAVLLFYILADARGAPGGKQRGAEGHAPRRPCYGRPIATIGASNYNVICRYCIFGGCINQWITIYICVGVGVPHPPFPFLL